MLVSSGAWGRGMPRLNAAGPLRVGEEAVELEHM